MSNTSELSFRRRKESRGCYNLPLPRTPASSVYCEGLAISHLVIEDESVNDEGEVDIVFGFVQLNSMVTVQGRGCEGRA